MHLPRGSEQREIVKRLSDTRAAIGSRFVCARTPPRGAPVVLVVSDRDAVPTAAAYLRDKHVTGAIEVKTAQQYFDQEYTLLEQIRRSAPREFKRARVQYEFPTHDLPCPVVHIELGFRARVTRMVMSWAEGAVRHYGADRVVYGYFDEAGGRLLGSEADLRVHRLDPLSTHTEQARGRGDATSPAAL
jgi:hypothetical protein